MKRRVYGQSQKLICPFCGNLATAKNEQGLPVCRHHAKNELNLKCVCGDWLDVREGKYGTFFLCINCGPVSYSKGLESNNLPLPRLEDL